MLRINNTTFLSSSQAKPAGLDPLHYNDLKKSGLSDETIQKARIRSIPLDHLKEKLGFIIPGICSAYEIPYDRVYARYRVFYEKGQETDKEGNKKPKYLQRKGTEARPYILQEVKAVATKVHKELWIVEGEKKALKLYQHGEYPISIAGVWNFGPSADDSGKRDLWEELKAFYWKGRNVYIAFDADLWTNSQVLMAFYEFAFRLYNEGANIKIPCWKISEGKGIDDYIVFHENKGKCAEDVIAQLKKEAKALKDFVSPEHEEAILRAFEKVDFDNPLKEEMLLKSIAKKLNIDKKTLKNEINRRRYQSKSELDSPSEEEKEEALALLRSPNLIDEYLEVCHTSYVGRDNELILVKLATVSRKFDESISVIFTGTPSVGKSELLKTVLKTVWSEDKEEYSRISPQYLLYRRKPLTHRVIAFYETEGTKSSAYPIRSAISEKRLSLGTVVSNKMGINAVEINKPTEGLVILSTYAFGNIGYELKTRIIEVEISHDEELARKVMHKINEYEILLPSEKLALEKQFRILQVADYLIEPHDVFIPYVGKLAEQFPNNEERFIRDYKKVLSLIKASALLYQYQREKDKYGRIIATEEDYKIVYRLSHLISGTMLPVPNQVIEFLKTVKRFEEKNKSLPTREEIMKELKKSEKTILRYCDDARRNDLIEVEGRGKKQKIKVLEIPEAVSPLPPLEKIFSNSDVRLSDSDKVLDFIEKNLDKAPCPGIVQSSQNGQQDKNGTKAFVLCNSLKYKEFPETGQLDMEVYKDFFDEKAEGEKSHHIARTQPARLDWCEEVCIMEPQHNLSMMKLCQRVKPCPKLRYRAEEAKKRC